MNYCMHELKTETPDPKGAGGQSELVPQRPGLTQTEREQQHDAPPVFHQFSNFSGTSHSKKQISPVMMMMMMMMQHIEPHGY